MNPLPKFQIETSGIESAVASLGRSAVNFGLKLIAAVAIFTIGMWLAGKITNGLKNIMERRKLDASLQSFLISLISIVLKIFVVVIVLTTVGVQMTSIVAVLGAASLAIGMALSGTLQNLAGGIVILLFKPFRVGDTIETASGKTGVVRRIMIFTTELRTFDNQTIYLPNGALANGVITNLSRGGAQRADLSVSIAYGDRVDVARREIMGILGHDERVLDTPAPSVFVSALGDSAVNLTARFWVKYGDMGTVTADVMEKIYDAFPKKKLRFPFPQMDVHVAK